MVAVGYLCKARAGAAWSGSQATVSRNQADRKRIREACSRTIVFFRPRDCLLNAAFTGTLDTRLVAAMNGTHHAVPCLELTTRSPYTGLSWSGQGLLCVVRRLGCICFRKPGPNRQRHGANCELLLKGVNGSSQGWLFGDVKSVKGGRK